MRRGAGAALALGVLALAARRRLLLVRVVGASMEPWAAAGDRLLARRGARGLRRGVVVVGRPPALGAGAEGAGLFVKRVAAVAGDPVPGGGGRLAPGRCWVVSDGPGADSRLWGPVAVADVVGVVVARLPSPRRQAGSGE